jgi:hypothetical protein
MKYFVKYRETCMFLHVTNSVVISAKGAQEKIRNASN